ncbi:hypothetical protein HK102_006878 [Quaeritorhiza haematococci]|nr:hypothetical protein HK102_006878 [Quaeritorhiza haematococci]
MSLPDLETALQAINLTDSHSHTPATATSPAPTNNTSAPALPTRGYLTATNLADYQYRNCQLYLHLSNDRHAGQSVPGAKRLAGGPLHTVTRSRFEKGKKVGGLEFRVRWCLGAAWVSSSELAC